jgi:hypothetical protein
MASPTLGLGEGSAETEETIGEYAAHETQMQEAVADVFSRTNSFGVHAAAKRIMDQLDELCHDEVGCPLCFSSCFEFSLVALHTIAYLHLPIRRVAMLSCGFCSVAQNMSEARPPVVLIGERGCGKSSLLANWVKQRRIRRQTTGSSPELVFLHLSGASRESNKVSTLLLRAVSELKAFFGLQVTSSRLARKGSVLAIAFDMRVLLHQMAVSSKEQKLSWEFMRAIESAARKGRVILVIDGVTQLESTMFARLKWLPLHFPANVRVILSATVNGAELALATGGNVPRSSSPARNLSGRSPARVQSTAILADTSDDESESAAAALDVITASGAVLKRNAGGMNKEIAELTRRGWQMIQVPLCLRV